ncbi:MAG: efflux RND transporter permease subunit [Firmicutes bacterium]|nr:efflux RND transporter permease subunit [Bacillota bacterium]
MFAEFSVNRPYTIIVGLIIVLILGAMSVYNTTTDLLPNINLPYAVIITAYPGASPELIELGVTRPIEQSMFTLGNIQNVYSMSANNVSMVILEFSEITNMDSAMIEIRENLDMITAFMPGDVSSPMIMRINPNLLPVSVVSVSLEGQSLADTSQFVNDTVIPEYERIVGVASVTATGLVNREIHVSLNQEKIDFQKQKLEQLVNSMLFLPSLFMQGTDFTALLQESGFDLEQLKDLELTKEMVSGIIQGQNLNMPAGYLTTQDNSYLVRVGDGLHTVDDLKQLPLLALPLPGQNPITLADISDIELVYNTGNTYTRVNDEEAIMLIFQKQTDYSTADIAKKIRQQSQKLQEKHAGLHITALMDQGVYTDLALNSMLDNMIYGTLLALAILIIFLRNIKPTFVVAVSIPVSIITSFVLMYFSNISLNIISMGGLALGVGMLVDNSIVVIENIYRMRSEGKSAKTAAVEGTKQIAGAITASTLTTVAVFLPIVFTYGMTRKIFTDMALTITYSLSASLLVALTFVPMISSRMLARDVPKPGRFTQAMTGFYTRIVKGALRKKPLIIAITVLLFIASAIGVWRMGTEFLPVSDSNQIMMQIEMSPDLSASDAAAVIDELTAILKDISDIDTIGISSSGTMLGPGFGGASGGTKTYSGYLLLKEDRSLTSTQIAQRIREQTENLNAKITISASGMDFTSIIGSPVTLNIMGPDMDTLQQIAKDVAAIVADVPGTVEVSDGLEDTAPELRIIVDKQKGIAKGITVGQVLLAVNQELSSDSAVTTLTVGNAEYSVFVTDPQTQLRAESELLDLEIDSFAGEPVRLGDIATIEQAKGFTTIMRQNQQRFVTVSANAEEGYTVGNISREIDRRLAGYQLPEGYKVEYGGEQMLILESFDELTLVLVVGVVLIYLVMVAEFQSLLSPLIVMATIPLAFTGGFLGLLFTGNPLSIVAFIGLIILTGVVVNNGIVLIVYINQLRSEGMAKQDAIVESCRIRLRPILMTALTTIFGLSTMSLGIGTGTDLIQPMAITAICGLAYATVLTLFVVPILYDAVNRG